jgi:hypothetical protein
VQTIRATNSSTGSSDAFARLGRMATPCGSRTAVVLHETSLLERSLHKELAKRLLAHEVPALVAELLEAAADDLTSTSPASRTETAEAEADSALRLVEAVERCKAMADAAGLEALARLAATIEAGERARFAELGRPRPSGWIEPDALTTMEVSTATGLGQQEVARRLRLATTRTPGAADLRGRLRRGAVGLARACVIAEEITPLPADAGRGIVESALREKDGAPPSPTLLRQRLTRACLAADREAVERRRASRRRRGAWARIDPDGLGVLTVVNDADRIVAAMERADDTARAARQAGDPRDLDALRADVVTDLLQHGWPADGDASHGGDGHTPSWSSRVGRRPPAHVTIVVPLSTALGVTDAPCEVPGRGWVAADHARQIMLNDGSTWRSLAVEARTGTALHLQTSAYRPTARMRAHVEAVDGTCRGPGCTVAAARCDLDHDIPWPHGPTHVDNLTSKHRAHHSLHTHGHWQVRRDRDGSVHWRTKAGRSYVTHPKDWLEGVRDTPGPGSHRVDATPGDDPPPF